MVLVASTQARLSAETRAQTMSLIFYYSFYYYSFLRPSLFVISNIYSLLLRKQAKTVAINIICTTAITVTIPSAMAITATKIW